MKRVELQVPWRAAGASQRAGHWLMGAAMLLVLLACVSDLDFRWRDTQLALQGVIDPQIRVELAVWLFAGVVVAWRLLHDRHWLLHRFPHGLGRATSLWLLVGAVALLSTLRGLGSLPMVRAGQLMILIFLVILMGRLLAGDHSMLLRWWEVWRRVCVIAVLGLAVASALLPAYRYDVTTYTGFSRLTLFWTHPITTGGFFGLALILLMGALLGHRDVWFEHRWIAAVGGVGAMVLLGLLGQTRARGPLLATLAGLFVLVVLSEDRRRRAIVGLLTSLLLVPVLWGAFDKGLSDVLVRGQSTEELSTLSGRTELFAYAGQLLWEQPVLGYGYLAARSVFLAEFPWAGESHNAFIDLAVSYGAVGIILYALLLSRIVQALRWGASAGMRGLAAEGWALFTFLMIMGFVGEGFAGTVGLEVVGFGVLIFLADGLVAVRRSAPPAAPARAS